MLCFFLLSPFVSCRTLPPSLAAYRAHRDTQARLLAFIVSKTTRYRAARFDSAARRKNASGRPGRGKQDATSGRGITWAAGHTKKGKKITEPSETKLVQGQADRSTYPRKPPTNDAPQRTDRLYRSGAVRRRRLRRAEEKEKPRYFRYAPPPSLSLSALLRSSLFHRGATARTSHTHAFNFTRPRVLLSLFLSLS